MREHLRPLASQEPGAGTSGPPTVWTRGTGWTLFAALMMVVTGSFTLIDGLVSLFRHRVYGFRRTDHLQLHRLGLDPDHHRIRPDHLRNDPVVASAVGTSGRRIHRHDQHGCPDNFSHGVSALVGDRDPAGRRRALGPGGPRRRRPGDGHGLSARRAGPMPSGHPKTVRCAFLPRPTVGDVRPRALEGVRLRAYLSGR
jgi:hypothetical protein